jgi:alpha-galactosidase
LTATPAAANFLETASFQIMTAAAPTVLRLDGRSTSIVFETRPVGAPLWRYWGPRLPEGASLPRRAEDMRPRPTFALDIDCPFSVFPTFGLGWFGQSALLAHRDGRDFAQDFSRSAVARDPSAEAIVVRLEDPVAKLAAELTISLSPGTDVVTLKTTLFNLGDAPLDLHWLAAGSLRLPPQARRVRYFAGRHNHEFIAHEEELGAAVWRRENRRGLTSHDAFPGALVGEPGAANDRGRVYAAHLAWSGNSAQTIDTLDDGARHWQFGPWLAPGEIGLLPGESFETPDLLATFSERGFDGAAQNFHAEIRARGPFAGALSPRPVHLNTWEGIYFGHREEDLKSLAAEAAEIGVERFVLDDGWFEGRNDDRSSLGDWRADKSKYPQGLRPLADHVRALGMEFGLWVEPEMVSEESALYRAHPDWALQLAGRNRITGRNQLVLDLARPDVGAYLYNALHALLSDLPISYLKWDHNRDLAPAAGADGRARYDAQTRAFYALLDRIRAEHPLVEIESCAGGGGRIDAGVLTRTHRVWTSDCLDAEMRLGMHRSFLQFFPPEVMGAHVGAAPAHATGRVHSVAFRAMTALSGHFGVELDPRKLSAEDRAALAFWIARYKELRHLLHGRKVWRGEDSDGLVWQAQGETEDFILFVARVKPAARRVAAPMRLPFVPRDRSYRIIEIGHADQGFLPAAGVALFETMRADGTILSGAWLADDGLPLPPLSPCSAALFRVTSP